MNCESCYEATVKSCSEEIILEAGLQANKSYFWIIENKFGQLSQRQTESDGDGKLAIDISLLPVLGSANPHAGHFKLSIRDGDNYLTEVAMVFGGASYKTVLFKFVDMDDDPENLYNVIK